MKYHREEIINVKNNYSPYKPTTQKYVKANSTQNGLDIYVLISTQMQLVLPLSETK